MPNLVKSLKKLSEMGNLETYYLIIITTTTRMRINDLLKLMTNVYDYEINQLLFFINFQTFLKLIL